MMDVPIKGIYSMRPLSRTDEAKRRVLEDRSELSPRQGSRA